MAKITFAPSPATAPRRAPRLVFRPADARRLFRRGDLAMCAGAIVVVCESERDEGNADPELSVRSSRGIDRTARAKSLQLLAGVDTQEFGPGYHDLLKFIAEAGAAH